MRKYLRQTGKLALLVMSLLLILGLGTPALATEPTEVTEPQNYTVDTESEIWQACDALSQELSAVQILVYDAASDEILYTKSVEGGKLYPASTTKLFSCYVALQYLSPDEIVTAGSELELVRPGSSMAFIYNGQSVTVETVVQAMMLPSGNDAAMILACAAGRRIAGDEELEPAEAVRVFVGEMNRQAKELDFEKSHFVNPDGYHMGAHYTCVNDMARIARLALENETISKLIQIHETDVVYASGQTNHWKNTNLLLDPEGEFYRPDAIGMKTGYTDPAGYSLMSAFRWGDRTLVIGVFGCSDELARFRDVITLADTCREVLE